jgi:hypothetical protein
MSLKLFELCGLLWLVVPFIFAFATAAFRAVVAAPSGVKQNSILLLALVQPSSDWTVKQLLLDVLDHPLTYLLVLLLQWTFVFCLLFSIAMVIQETIDASKGSVRTFFYLAFKGLWDNLLGLFNPAYIACCGLLVFVFAKFTLMSFVYSMLLIIVGLFAIDVQSHSTNKALRFLIYPLTMLAYWQTAALMGLPIINPLGTLFGTVICEPFENVVVQQIGNVVAIYGPSNQVSAFLPLVVRMLGGVVRFGFGHLGSVIYEFKSSATAAKAANAFQATLDEQRGKGWMTWGIPKETNDVLEGANCFLISKLDRLIGNYRNIPLPEVIPSSIQIIHFHNVEHVFGYFPHNWTVIQKIMRMMTTGWMALFPDDVRLWLFEQLLTKPRLTTVGFASSMALQMFVWKLIQRRFWDKVFASTVQPMVARALEVGRMIQQRAIANKQIQHMQQVIVERMMKLHTFGSHRGFWQPLQPRNLILPARSSRITHSVKVFARHVPRYAFVIGCGYFSWFSLAHGLKYPEWRNPHLFSFRRLYDEPDRFYDWFK